MRWKMNYHRKREDVAKMKKLRSGQKRVLVKVEHDKMKK